MKKYLLSINGGGIRGIIVLYFLLHLENDLLSKGSSIYKKFDMYAGTSVGAMIAGTIAYHQYTIAEILVIYNDEAFRSIFTKTNSFFSRFLYGPIYDGEYKSALIADSFNTMKMSSSSKPVLFTVYSIDQQKPKVFKSYTIDDMESQGNGTEMLSTGNVRKRIDSVVSDSGTDELVSEIIDASSSPPGYFGSIKYTDKTGEHYGVDGALFANNPCDCAYADALQLFKDDEIKVLSIGTGSSNLKYLHEETMHWGFLQWVAKGNIFDIIMNSSPDTVDYKMKHFANALGHTYLYIDHKSDIAIDDVSKIQELKEIGRQWYIQSKDQLDEFFAD